MRKSTTDSALSVMLLAVVLCGCNTPSPTSNANNKNNQQTQVRPTPPDGLKCFNAMFKNCEVDTVCKAPGIGYVDKYTYKPISIDFNTGKITPR
jgi:PBP1b-binding outer membrane lipoprotein LpoB